MVVEVVEVESVVGLRVEREWAAAGLLRIGEADSESG